MSYQMQRAEDYPGTGLPVYQVFDAEEYADTSRRPRPIGEVWGVGSAGVTGRYIPTGVRWQLSGSLAESPTYPAGAYAEAARAMIAAFDAD
jgi:hypothetical protein